MLLYKRKELALCHWITGLSSPTEWLQVLRQQVKQNLGELQLTPIHVLSSHRMALLVVCPCAFSR